MTALEMTAAIRARGVVLRLNGDHLRVEASPELLTDSIVAALRENKAAVMALLAAERADRVLAAIGAAGEVDLTGLYQHLADVPIADLRQVLGDLVTSGRIHREERPVSGLAGCVVAIYSLDSKHRSI
jgi:hypothetical protein